jgi:RNA polymerase sigma-70 factor (ECF subfamily)
MEQLLKGLNQKVLTPRRGKIAQADVDITRGDDQETSIRDVVSRIRAGEVELFEAIVERYQGEIYSVAWKMTHNYDDAADVVQETFLRVYRAIGSWTGRARFSTWLYRIAMNTSLDYLRRQSKHYKKRYYTNHTEEDNLGHRQELEGIDYTTPLDEVKKRRLKERIQKMLLKISPMQRKCFILHFFQEKSLKEISEILRCNIGTVKRHIHRAKIRLRELLKETEQ